MTSSGAGGFNTFPSVPAKKPLAGFRPPVFKPDAASKTARAPLAALSGNQGMAAFFSSSAAVRTKPANPIKQFDLPKPKSMTLSHQPAAVRPAPTLKKALPIASTFAVKPTSKAATTTTSRGADYQSLSDAFRGLSVSSSNSNHATVKRATASPRRKVVSPAKSPVRPAPSLESLRALTQTEEPASFSPQEQEKLEIEPVAEESAPSPLRPVASPLRSPAPVAAAPASTNALKEKKRQMARARMDAKLKRAQDLEAAGDSYAAMALYRDLALDDPSNPQVEASIARLRSELRSQQVVPVTQDLHELIASSGESAPKISDPLAEAFEAGAGDAETTEETETPGRLPAEDGEDAETGTVEAPSRVLRRAERFLQSNAASDLDEKTTRVFQSLAGVLRALAGYEVEVGSPSSTKRATFRSYDGVSTLEPPRALEDLISLDEVVQKVLQVIQSGAEAARLMTPKASAREYAQRFLTMCGGDDGFAGCALRQSVFGTCAHTTTSATCPKTGSIAPKTRLSQLINSGLRCCLRASLNPQFRLSGGSYRYNENDPASAVHHALLLMDAHKSKAESFVLGLSGTQQVYVEESEENEIIVVQEFVEAHAFLSSLFPTVEALSRMREASPPSAWLKFRRYQALAREHRCADELVLAPLSEDTRMRSFIEGFDRLVGTAKSWLETKRFKRQTAELRTACPCAANRRRDADPNNAVWAAPSLTRGGGASGNNCGACRRPAGESHIVRCECCEVKFHSKCLDLAETVAEFVCTKCAAYVDPARREERRAAKERERLELLAMDEEE